VATGVFHAPCHESRTLEPYSDGFCDRRLLVHALVQHKIWDHGCAYPISTGAVEQQWTTPSLPDSLEDPVHGLVTDGPRDNRDDLVTKAKPLCHCTFVEGTWLVGRADVQYGRPASCSECFELRFGRLAAGDDVGQGLKCIRYARQGFVWSARRVRHG